MNHCRFLLTHIIYACNCIFKKNMKQLYALLTVGFPGWQRFAFTSIWKYSNIIMSLVILLPLLIHGHPVHGVPRVTPPRTLNTTKDDHSPPSTWDSFIEEYTKKIKVYSLWKTHSQYKNRNVLFNVCLINHSQFTPFHELTLVHGGMVL